MLLAVSPACAQQQEGQPSLMLPKDAPMTLAEFQGLGCASVGAVAGLVALVYVGPIEEATIRISTAMLVAPVVATGFAIGCSVGATLAPAFLWAYRHVAD